MSRCCVTPLLILWSLAARAQATDSIITDPVAIAANEAERGWSARTVRVGDAVVFPFGRTQPTVMCAPLRACVIELEAGEVILGTAAGDAERWLIDRTVTGAGGRTALVVVKPTACGITTNLVLSTDRRVYDLTLTAMPCAGKAGDAGEAYARHVSFYYPDPLVGRRDKSLSLSGIGARGEGAEALNFAYHWTSGRRVRWSPAQVYDDGVHTYIKLPPEAVHAEMPALFVVDQDGRLGILNYAITGGDTFIADRVLERAVLVIGANGREGKVEIVNDRLAAAR
jgi:P-type conjugative transfer protein TrbG